MSYKALLFCPDEKTARVVTQVLSDLEFRVEPCNEPFAAVKRLMAEHFDAIVVDCDNEQNAALLFKSAHNSGTNQSSLAVAVVEGQTGVAKAFRIGANLVLTKPINVEQSKGTLRVARGLLRKTDASKPASVTPPPNPKPRPVVTAQPARQPAPPVIASKPVFLPAQPPPSPIPAMSTTLFQAEEEAGPKPEPTEAAFLESIPEAVELKNPSADSPAAPASAKEYPWQPISKPMAGPMTTALRRAAEAAGKSDTDSPAHDAVSSEAVHSSEVSSAATMGRSFSTASTGMSSAAAAAPAREPVKIEKPAETRHVEAPAFSSLDVKAAEPASGGSKNGILIAAVVVLAAALGYVGWTKLHPANEPAATVRPAAPAQSAPAPPQTAVPQSANPAQPKAGLPTAASPLPVEPKTDQRFEQKSEAAPSFEKTAPEKKSTSIVAPDTVVRTAASAPKETIDASSNSPAPMVVRNQAPAQPPAPAAQEPAPAPAPTLVADGSQNDQAISGIVSSPAVSLPQHTETVKVSQGVSQGLLVKNVQPVYPSVARQMRIQGNVELLANIGKDGSITKVKVLNGDSTLAQAAIDAVKQWKYKPYYLNGEPVEIQTQVTVKFKLP